MAFIISDWYWYVGTDRTKVYSSKIADYVLVSDAAYVNWLTNPQHKPTLISSEVSLFKMLLGSYPMGTKIGQAAQLAEGSVNITSTGVPALNGTYAINDAARNTITSIAAAINAGLGLPGGGSTFIYPDINGNTHLWPAPQFTDLAKAMMNYIYQVNMVVTGVSNSLPSPNIIII